MSRFIKIPSYYMIPDGKGHWVSDSELVFYSSRFDVTITIPPGSVNNLASIPWFLRRVFNVNGPHRPAAALHDPLYSLHGVTKNKTYTRKECDQIFLDAMLVTQISYFLALPEKIRLRMMEIDLARAFYSYDSVVGKMKAKLMYYGVRIGGKAAFKGKA